MVFWPQVFPFYPIGPGLMGIAIFVVGLARPGDALEDDTYLFVDHSDCDHDD
ncbi:hypothetical protein [Oceanicola sp. 22II-s10i]|uniref:hypothetical protein n=1 Tax=Oceanicola sp. 22II-s10i TaxID=1317116 RepID=UPI001C3E7818|nr:hypothetical protein [Oceanicola sp. 22II-s10i]